MAILEVGGDWMTRVRAVAFDSVDVKTRGLGDLLNSSVGLKLAFGCVSVPVDLILQSTRNKDKETAVKSINDSQSASCR